MRTNWVSAQGGVFGAKGIDKEETFSMETSRDPEHGKFSFRLEMLGKVEKEYVTYFN
jgi:hypothetical protein